MRCLRRCQHFRPLRRLFLVQQLLAHPHLRYPADRKNLSRWGLEIRLQPPSISNSSQQQPRARASLKPNIRAICPTIWSILHPHIRCSLHPSTSLTAHALQPQRHLEYRSWRPSLNSARASEMDRGRRGRTSIRYNLGNWVISVATAIFFI